MLYNITHYKQRYIVMHMTYLARTEAYMQVTHIIYKHTYILTHYEPKIKMMHTT